MQFPVGRISTRLDVRTTRDCGAQFLAAAALLYAVGRLIVVPAVRLALSRTATNKTVARR